MRMKNNLIRVMKNKVFGCFFAILLMLSSLFGITPGLTENAYAEPEGQPTQSGITCEDSLGSLGWLVCPGTGKISEAVDFLYDKIDGILEINPVEAKDGSPIYDIWKYFQGVTNIVFIVFLLVVVFSQVTGVGIANYGIKKTLPKLIIAAVLVNLSFYICSLAVDTSNIFGASIRGLFESIASSPEGSQAIGGVELSEIYSALAGGTGLAIAGTVVALETGVIWMLIPLALGALVSVVIGLITIAMRQAVVTVLIMVAPLAMVAYILPNTEQWFRKWRHTLFQMLIFYPAFSLLFGASSVAGWAIIISSQNGFGILIGVAVQIFPLFFSWHLMKMSGTILGTINSKLNALASRPLGGVRGWATSHRELARQKHMASPKAYTPTLRLQQFLSDRKIARDEETKEHMETVKNRGLAYATTRNYKRGTDIPSKEGEESYEAQARNAEYQKIIQRHKNNMNKGMGTLAAVKQNGTLEQKARLNALDVQNVQAFDTLKMEQARGEMIDFDNASGFHHRMEDAINVNVDDTAGWTTTEDGRRVRKPDYKTHFDVNNSNSATRRAEFARETQARERYERLSRVMEGEATYKHYAAATAAHGYDTQNKIVGTKMQKYFDLTPPTKDLTYRMDELIKSGDVSANIDTIIPGLRTLNARGDTDLVRERMRDMLDKDIGGGIEYGTHASQALASFLMFDVKDSDPFLRRFGKYINLETANVFNKNTRKDMALDYGEYVRGYHFEINEQTGKVEKMLAKKGMKELMEGTSLDNVERTAFSSLDDSLKEAYSEYVKNAEGKMIKAINVDKYLEKRREIQEAIGPQFISASLKYLSGSEQLANAVSFLTGYKYGVKEDENGNPMKDGEGNPVYDWNPVWESKKSGLSGEAEKVRKYFQARTLEYIIGQTPTQILGLRSDYKNPLTKHLYAAYEEIENMNKDEWTDEEILEHEEYIKELAKLQTEYTDLDQNDENALAEYKKKKKELENKMVGAQFRQLLNSKGKLNQIYRTRRSGAANNAKDWLREWLDLDDEVAISVKLEKDRARDKARFEKEKKEKYGDQPDAENPVNNRVYTESDISEFTLHVEDIFNDLKDEDGRDAFFKESSEYIAKTLGANSYIAVSYRKYYEEDPYADSHTLKEYLLELLRDPGCY